MTSEENTHTPLPDRTGDIIRTERSELSKDADHSRMGATTIQCNDGYTYAARRIASKKTFQENTCTISTAFVLSENLGQNEKRGRGRK